MNVLGVMRWWLTVTTVAVTLLWAPAVQAAVPASWKDTGFSIDPAGMTLRSVMEQFGQVYGVRLSFEVKDTPVSKERLKSDSGTEFLDRLAQPYRFRWFVYGDTLYIVPRDDNASVRLEVGEDAVQDAKGALVGMGLFDSRFGWGELPDEGIVIISGPREYVRLAREILLPDAAKAALKGKQIMVFRLKYASATDRVINARGRTETIPGIKTILNNLVFGDAAASSYEDPSTRFDADRSKRSYTPKKGRGEAQEMPRSPFSLSGSHAERTSEPEEPAAPRASKTKTSSSDSRPRIEADPSLNAIMIYDQVNKREMYQALINELDIQPQQIEIEALIVDIDRSKLSELGVEWGVRSGGGNVVGRVNSTQSDSQGVDLPLPGATLLISNAARFYARLKAMEGTGEARVLATPTVLTLDNVAAVLDLSQTRYVPLLGERFADLADITAGTMLRVIPRIVQDGPATRVRLEVDIEDGAIGDSASQANVTRSTISTQAIIELQQTLMIGGYRSESVSSNYQKVPVLGDVPLFGNLFRNESKSHGSRERLFLITPRLLTPIGVAAAPTSKASDVARKNIPPQSPLSILPSESVAVTEMSSNAPAGSLAKAVAQADTKPAAAPAAATVPRIEVAKVEETRDSRPPVASRPVAMPSKFPGGMELQLATAFMNVKPSLLAASSAYSAYKCGRAKGPSSIPARTQLF